MATLDTMVTDNGIIAAPQHVLVFGPPKTGKTELIGKLAMQGFKLIWFDAENGKATLLKMPREALANITYIGMKDTKEYPIAHATMDKIVRGGTFQICDTHGRVDCAICKKDDLAFTTITVPTVFSIVEAKKAAALASGIPAQWTEEDELRDTEIAKTIFVLDSSTQLTMSITNTLLKDKPVDYQETIHDYRNQGNYLNRIFGYIQQAQFHFITTAHEIEAEREDGSMKIVPSIGTRNYAINCGKFFDHLVYTDKKNGAHIAASKTTYSNNILTGSRLDIAVESMAKPDLTEIFRGKVSNTGISMVQQASSNTAQTKAVLTGVGNKISGLKIGGQQ